MGDPVFRSDTRSHAFPFPFARKMACKCRHRQGEGATGSKGRPAKVEFLRKLRKFERRQNHRQSKAAASLV
jgi:hypothetical protein